MPEPALAHIEEGVIDVLKTVSRRPIEPTLAATWSPISVSTRCRCSK